MSEILDEKLSKLSADQLDLWKMRHSAEHVLTFAMQRVFGEKAFYMAMGPATDDGFYFDFEQLGDFSVNESDFAKIEKEMSKIIKEDLPFVKKEVSVKEARKLFGGNPYKIEWIDQIEERGEKVSIYYTGNDFFDLCSGPHIASTGQIKAFKLLNIAGAYWHGDEKNKMLARIYGTTFPSVDQLKDYIEKLEEAKKRDHRKLGKELDLFVFSDLVGPGLPLYTRKGALVRRLIQDVTKELQQPYGFEEVWTPQITKADLFKVSGHYDKYKDGMFKVISNYTKEEYYLKPMNCPNHCVLFGSQLRSYKDLPIRYADFANLYRDEKPGELSGLTRLRAFSQDDAHCFCSADQIKSEILNVISITKKALQIYGINYWIRLSLWDENEKEKYLGDPQTWEKSQKLLEDILVENKIEYKKAIGEAAIYGPKMDFMAVDVLGREWQISTTQLDFIMPQRFGLKYTDKDGALKTPVMIHRAIVGSPERFMALLIEHCAGAFPIWLAPIQVVVIPISENQMLYAKEVAEKLLAQNVRVEVWEDGSMQKRIKVAEKQKVPYMLIVGQKEAESESVSVRARGQQDMGVMLNKDFLKKIKSSIESKSLGL